MRARAFVFLAEGSTVSEAIGIELNLDGVVDDLAEVALLVEKADTDNGTLRSPAALS